MPVRLSGGVSLRIRPGHRWGKVPLEALGMAFVEWKTGVGGAARGTSWGHLLPSGLQFGLWEQDRGLGPGRAAAWLPAPRATWPPGPSLASAASQPTAGPPEPRP